MPTRLVRHQDRGNIDSLRVLLGTAHDHTPVLPGLAVRYNNGRGSGFLRVHHLVRSWLRLRRTAMVEVGARKKTKSIIGAVHYCCTSPRQAREERESVYSTVVSVRALRGAGSLRRSYRGRRQTRRTARVGRYVRLWRRLQKKCLILPTTYLMLNSSENTALCSARGPLTTRQTRRRPAAIIYSTFFPPRQQHREMVTDSLQEKDTTPTEPKAGS